MSTQEIEVGGQNKGQQRTNQQNKDKIRKKLNETTSKENTLGEERSENQENHKGGSHTTCRRKSGSPMLRNHI